MSKLLLLIDPLNQLCQVLRPLKYQLPTAGGPASGAGGGQGLDVGAGVPCLNVGALFYSCLDGGTGDVQDLSAEPGGVKCLATEEAGVAVNLYQNESCNPSLPKKDSTLEGVLAVEGDGQSLPKEGGHLGQDV